MRHGAFYAAILEHVLVGDPDFSDLDALTEETKSGVLSFIEDVEGLLKSLWSRE